MIESNKDNQLIKDNEQDEKAVDTISNLFEEEDRILSERRASSAQNKEKTTEKVEDKKEAKEEEIEPSKVDAFKEERQSLKEELEKTHKRLAENQNYGRQNAQRLKTALKVTREFVEEGSLSEEEAAKLLGSLESGDTEEDVSAHHNHPFGKVLTLANKELENIRKYTDDDRLDDKVAAFDYFLLVAPKEEQEQALEDLTDLLDNPLTLAKKMLAIGQSYETSYREMKAAGGLQGMIATKDQTILNLRKNIDKLTKKLAQYEDYDKPRYRIDDHVGDVGGSTEEDTSGDSITSLFHHRDAPLGLVRQR